MSWWVGLGRAEFYEFIKTHNFSYHNRKGMMPSWSDPDAFKTNLSYGSSKSRIVKFIPTYTGGAPRTNFASDQRKEKNLEVIPYYEWSK